MDLTKIFGEKLARPPWEYLYNIRNTNNNNEKDKYLQQSIDEENWVFIEGLYRGLNPMYRIENPIAHLKTNDYGFGYTWEQFKQLDDDLVKHKIMPSTKADRVRAAMEDCDPIVWNEWFRFILNRNFNANISYKRFNKIIKKNNLLDWHIDAFFPQLSHECVSRPKYIPGKKLIDYITPGVRLIVLASPDSDAIAMTHNGKHVRYYTNTINEYTNFAHQFLKEPMIFDGEVLSEEYHMLLERGYTHGNVRVMDAIHYVYDVIPWKEYIDRFFEQPLMSRRHTLEKLINSAHNNNFLPNTRLNKYIVLDLDPDTGEGMSELHQHYTDAVDLGYLGVMLKRVDKPYKCCRTQDWLSMKKRETVTLHIEHIEKFDDKDSAKKILCKGWYNNNEMIVNVWRGITDADRKWLWENKDELKYSKIEIFCTSITDPNKYKPYYSVNNPTFSRVILDDEDEA